MADLEEQRRVINHPAAHENLGWFPINHASYFSRLWKGFIALVAVYIAGSLPFFLGFSNDYDPKLTISDYCISFIVFADFIFTLSTSFTDEETNTRVTEKVRIIRNYGVWAIIDLFSVLPYTFFKHFIQIPHLAKVIALLRLVYLRKALRGLNMLKDINFRWANTLATCLKLFLGTIFSLHIMACIFFYLSRDNPHIDRTWRKDAPEATKKRFKYIMSMYWSTTSLSTVGYGDLHPVNSNEMIFGVISMLFGIVFCNNLSIHLSKLLSGDDRPQYQRDYVRILERFGRNMDGYPESARKEIKKFLRAQHFSSNPPLKVRQIFSKLTQVEMYKRCISPIFGDLYLFQDVSRSFIYQIMAEMSIEEFELEMPIIMAKDRPGKMFIFLDGDIVWEGSNYRSRIFGEMGYIGNLPQPFTIRPRKRTSVLSLKQSSVLKLVRVNREDGDILIANMLEHLRTQVRLRTYLVKDPLRKFYVRFEERLDWGRIDIPVSLMFAIKRPNPSLLLHLIKSGENLDYIYDDKEQQNILHIAVIRENIEPTIIETLLRHCGSHLHRTDSAYRDPLGYAIGRSTNKDVTDAEKERSAQVVQLFRDFGIRLTQASAAECYTDAIVGRRVDMLEMVHSFGGDVNIHCRSDGDTPLLKCVKLGYGEGIKTLIKLNVNPEVPNYEGVTATTAFNVIGSSGPSFSAIRSSQPHHG